MQCLLCLAFTAYRIGDATIIESANSTKKKTKEKDPEMYQIQKGKQWFFDLKAYNAQAK